MSKYGKYSLHVSMLNGRPLVTIFDEFEKVVEIVIKYSLYLNTNLKYSPKSIKSYIEDVKKLLDFIRSSGFLTFFHDRSELLLKVSSVHIIQFLHHLRNDGNGDATIRSCDARLRAFFFWLYSFKSSYIVDFELNPYSDGKYKTPKPIRNSKKFIMAEELICFLNSFSSEHDRVLGHFMYDTGARVSETERVRLSHLPDPENYPKEFVYFPITIYGSKGRGGIIKERVSLISKVVLDRMWRYYNNWVKPNTKPRNVDVPIFHGVRGKPIKPKSITDKYYQKSLVLLEKKIISSAITPHRLRHGSAFSLMRSELGQDMLEKLVLVKKHLGHAYLSTTDVYGNVPINVLLRIRKLNEEKEVFTRTEESEYIFKKTFIKIY